MCVNKLIITHKKQEEWAKWINENKNQNENTTKRSIKTLMGIKFITQTVECWIFSTLKRVSVFVCKWKMDDVPTISQNIMLLLCIRSVHYCREVKITWEWRFWIALWRSVGWVSMKVELRADIDVVNDAIDCMTKNRWSATFRLYGRIFDGATVWTWFLNEFLTFHPGPNWFTALHAIILAAFTVWYRTKVIEFNFVALYRHNIT